MKRKYRKIKHETTKRIEIRVTEKEKNRIIFLSKQYAGGNLTIWLVHGALNAPRQYLVKK